MESATDDCGEKRAKSSDEENKERDYISHLPDEILITILSHLSIDEAARSITLSNRWKYLWTFFCGFLEFSFGSEFIYVSDKSDPKFVSTVNQVMNSLKSPTLKGLRIYVEMRHNSRHSDCDSWIRFALGKKVRSLDLFFGTFLDYVFPSSLFTDTSFDSLRAITVKCVTWTQGTLECLLTCCPLLEFLRIRQSYFPESVKFSGHF